MHVHCGRDSIVLLCTSGFVDDVMFSHSGPYIASCVFLSGRSLNYCVDKARQVLAARRGLNLVSRIVFVVDCDLTIEPPCQLNVPPSRSSSDIDLHSVSSCVESSLSIDICYQNLSFRPLLSPSTREGCDVHQCIAISDVKTFFALFIPVAFFDVFFFIFFDVYYYKTRTQQLPG